MPTLTAKYLIELLTQFVDETGASIDLLLVGALAASPQDTALFLFQKTVDLFCETLSSSSH